jgi:hypothetical protein
MITPLIVLIVLNLDNQFKHEAQLSYLKQAVNDTSIDKNQSLVNFEKIAKK